MMRRREFTSSISMGNGQISLAKCYRVHQMVEDVFKLLGGLQQPRMATEEPESPEERAQRLEEERDLKVLLEDIQCALGCVKS